MFQMELFYSLDSPYLNIKEYFEKFICPEEDENTINDEIRYNTGKSSIDQVITRLMVILE